MHSHRDQNVAWVPAKRAERTVWLDRPLIYAEWNGKHGCAQVNPKDSLGYWGMLSRIPSNISTCRGVRVMWWMGVFFFFFLLFGGIIKLFVVIHKQFLQIYDYMSISVAEKLIDFLKCNNLKYGIHQLNIVDDKASYYPFCWWVFCVCCFPTFWISRTCQGVLQGSVLGPVLAKVCEVWGRDNLLYCREDPYQGTLQ